MCEQDHLMRRLQHALCQHGVGNLDESSDIGTLYVVGLLALTAVFHAGLMNIRHDML
ncbi:Uncharacterised protein [Serratia quinivorans]|uniref:Uncharacterized protein n=1 Tax=Serratia quinivorans TaxID=137545 RepID=A0A379ZKB0_9GAMM|nr:Uncharacterised protein [Serratia quinivorans]